MPEANHSEAARKQQAVPITKPPHKTGHFARIALLLLFLITSGALVYGVHTILNRQPDKSIGRFQKALTSFGAPPASKTQQPTSGKEAMISALPTPPSEQPPLIEPPPPLSEGMNTKSQGMNALAVLEKFIAAKSLAERMPIIETKTPDAELAASCLAGPLPPAPKMLLEFQAPNAIEQVVDFYYNVDFQMENNRMNPQTILVRTRGGGAPKVVVDPFLDLFGGRLAAYASKPSDKAGVFQVIASALASCTDPLIPEREKKLTLKLLPQDNTKEIALAYFGKMSKIHEMLEDGSHCLSYGKAKSCTVMLAWNTKDNPEHPFLEAVALKALDWNP